MNLLEIVGMAYEQCVFQKNSYIHEKLDPQNMSAMRYHFHTYMCVSLYYR